MKKSFEGIGMSVITEKVIKIVFQKDTDMNISSDRDSYVGTVLGNLKAYADKVQYLGYDDSSDEYIFHVKDTINTDTFLLRAGCEVLDSEGMVYVDRNCIPFDNLYTMIDYVSYLLGVMLT